MKHQTITLLKFKTLAALLKMPLWQVIGILEGVWLFTMHNARNGDLSRFSPLELAAWLEYDGDASHLIESLVQTRWLDRAGDDLVVHDWADHKPTWLKGVEARQLGDGLSGELSTEPTPTLTGAKSGTKQVRVRVLGTGTNTVSIPGGQRRKQFTKPTLADIDAYCRERDNNIDPEEFIDHYEQVGWVCGKNRSPMKDWKAAIRNWEKRRKQPPAESRVATAGDLEAFDLVTGGVR